MVFFQFLLYVWWIGESGGGWNKHLVFIIAWSSQLLELYVELNLHRDLVLVQFADLLYCHLGTLPVLSGHHDSYPFDQIFYRLVFVVYFHPPMRAADPISLNFLLSLIKNNFPGKRSRIETEKSKKVSHNVAV